MDLHQLYVFVKVVEHKSFSKAAEDIFLSQSTVSSHIQCLEKSFNVPLFDRVGRESVLTPHGERLYKWAQKMLSLKDELMLDMKKGETDFSGVIKIAASSVPCQVIVPEMIQKFREKYENVTFQINQAPSKLVADNVLNGKVDIGFLGEKYEHGRLHYVPLLKEKLVLVASKDLNMEAPVKIEHIANFPFVMRGSDSGTQATIERLLKKHHISKDSIQVVAKTDCFQSLMKFVKLGAGVSLVSELAAKEYTEDDNIQMYELEDIEEERYFYLVYNINKTLPIAAKMFIEEIDSLIIS